MSSESEEQADLWDRWADDYDADYRTYYARDPTPAVAFLAEYATTGSALELGPGSGRVAIPLAEHGVSVIGIEISPEMAATLERRRGVLPVTVRVGDMADVDIDGRFTLIYTVWSAFFSLLTQERQVECFRNVAKAMTPSGWFVIEGVVPHVTGNLAACQAVAIRGLGPDRLDISATLHNAATQRIDFQEVHITDSGIRLRPVRIRYVWPAELDLMAQLAGMRLHARYGDFDKRPYTATCTYQVSVYGLA